METINSINKVNQQSIQLIINNLINQLTPTKLMHKLKLKFSIKNIFPLPKQFLTTSIIFLIQTRFPLLLSQPHTKQQIINMDSCLKNMYQTQLKNSHLVQPSDFQHFVLICVKLTSETINIICKDIIVTFQEQEDICCILMKVLLGITIVPTCYKYLQKKYVDQEMYQLKNLSLQRMQTLVRQAIDFSSGTKKLVTMNAIQSKMQKRKIKNTKMDRPSIQVQSINQNLTQFKDQLNKSLKVPPSKKTQKIKQKYHSLQKLVYSIDTNIPQSQSQTKRKKIIHTQQLSSSMQLNLLLQQSQQSYTKRDFILRHSNPSPHLSHRIFQTSLDNTSKQHLQLPRLQQRRSYNPKTLSKKTRTYWNKIKQNIRQFNKNMLY